MAIPDLEGGILLCVGRSQLADEHRGRLEILVRQQVDWTRLSRLASLHGLTPLLCFHLQQVCADAVPRAVLEQLTDQWRTVAAHNLLLTSETMRLLKLLEAAGIPAVAYKGPVLSLQLYGSVGLRPARDLDLLVSPKEVAAATNVLESNGYMLWSRVDPGRAESLVRWQCEYVFRSATGTHVELHWTVAPRFASVPLDYKRLWRRLRRVRLEEADVSRQTAAGGRDAEIATLAPEDLLFILSVHGAKHLWNQLKWICDIGELIARSPDLDWNEVLGDARARRARRLVLLGLWLTHTLLGHDIPREVVRQVTADEQVRSLARDVAERLFWETTPLIPMAHAIHFNLRARESLVDKVRYGAGLALFPTDGDVAAFPLPSSLSFAYCLVRPFRMLTKHAPSTVWQALKS